MSEEEKEEREEKSFCPRCGKELSSMHTFCKECRAKIKEKHQ